MNVRQRRKLFAGTGMFSMLVGALMVLAPGAGATPPANDQVCAPLDSGKIDTSLEPATVTVNAPAGKLIDGYCVKAGSKQNDFGPVYVDLNPPVASVVIDYPDKDSISHYSVSYTDAGKISVDKVVTGSAKPTPPVAYTFTVDCGTWDLNGDAADTGAQFTLTDAQEPWISGWIPSGTSCTVTESSAQGATTTYSVPGGHIVVPVNQTSTVTVTNDYPGEQTDKPGLTVTKVVDGNAAPGVDLRLRAVPGDRGGHRVHHRGGAHLRDLHADPRGALDRLRGHRHREVLDRGARQQGAEHRVRGG